MSKLFVTNPASYLKTIKNYYFYYCVDYRFDYHFLSYEKLNISENFIVRASGNSIKTKTKIKAE